MKKILSIIMLLGMVCLVGCKEDQQVSFSIKEINFGKDSETKQVEIIANCPWVITGLGDFIKTSVDCGNGNELISVTAWSNNDYDDRTHLITVQSEDGTSLDHLYISQSANIGLELEKPEMIKAEGGDFELKIKTNDDITGIETPDWITYTSSRALSEYTYTFTAEPNKTGSVRRGDIRYRGKNLTDYVKIEQDSYMPVRVKPEKDTICTTNHEVSIPLTAEPEYADISKLRLSYRYVPTNNYENFHMSIENGNLNVSMEKHGHYTVFLEDDERNILSLVDIAYLPSYPLSIYGRELYTGESIWYSCPFALTSFFDTYSSDPTVIKTYQNYIIAVGEGTATVTYECPDASIFHQTEITVKPVIVEAVGSWSSYSNSDYEYIFMAKIKCKHNFEVLQCLILNNQNRVIEDKYTISSDGILYTKKIKIPRGDYKHRYEAVKGYSLWMSITTNGNTHQIIQPINVNRWGSFSE